MGKFIRRLVVAILMLVLVLTLTPTTAYADSEMMLKNKTNKLTLIDSVKEGSKKIEETLAVGKSLTYNIEVPKGVLYIELTDKTSYKVEIFNSKNEVVKKIDSVETMGGIIYQVKYSVPLSKGKYKIKISPKNKKSALNINGLVAMIHNSTSRSIAIEKYYSTPVTKGKTYKFKFEVKEESLFGFANLITSYDPNDLFYFDDSTFNIVNSAGKTVKSYDTYNIASTITLKKGTYTIVLKASRTGLLSTIVNEGNDYNLDLNFDFSNYGK